MNRCQEGHLYDPAKHAGCPWCGGGSPFDEIVSAASGKTVALRPGAASAPPPPPAAGGLAAAKPVLQAASGGATVRLVEKQTGINPVVGWLVCTAGPMRGQDFRLHGEKNFIGRDPSMQVCLSKDDAVSREKHASVVFEPKKRIFWLNPGDASGLVYRNGELVNTPVPLQERDLIEVGASTLALVPFVNEQFQWEALQA